MRSIIAMNFLGASVIAFLACGCAMGAEAETESVGQAEQALSESTAKAPVAQKAGAVRATSYGTYSSVDLHAGTTLFKTFSNLGKNCKLTAYTTGATTVTDPVIGIIIANGTPPWGSSSPPCYRGAPKSVDGYNTLSFNDDAAFPDRNSSVSWKNPNGGNALSVHVVGSLYGGSPTYGSLYLYYQVSECDNPAQNRALFSESVNFQANGAYANLSGNVTTVAASSGGASDPTLYELDASAPANSNDSGGSHGAGKCNDDCASGTQSCIPGNSSNTLWYFAEGWYSSGNIQVHN